VSAAPPAPVDPLARATALAIGAGRVGLGLGISAATGRALALLGFERPQPPTVALARLAGGRDIALGVHTLAVASDPGRLRQATAIGALVDLGDALAFGAALGAGGRIRRTALLNVPIAAGAAIVGAWAFRRLG
jgi:hypothetical protein